MRLPILAITLSAIPLFTVNLQDTFVADKPPNFVIIMADDLGYGDLNDEIAGKLFNLSTDPGETKPVENETIKKQLRSAFQEWERS